MTMMVMALMIAEAGMIRLGVRRGGVYGKKHVADRTVHTNKYSVSYDRVTDVELKNLRYLSDGLDVTEG